MFFDLQKIYWPKFIGLSLFIHFSIYFLLNFSLPEKKENFSLEKALEGKKITSLELNSMPPQKLEEIRKLRRLGVQNGKKDFSVPMGKNPVKELKASESSTQQVDLKSLGTKFTPELKAQSKEVAVNRKGVSIKKWKESSSSEIKISSQDRRDQQTMKQAFMNRLQSNEGIFQAMEKSDLNIKFAPPDGVPEDELNSLEKKFFSFQKRTYTSYINNFINQYNQLSLAKPNLKNNLLGYHHHLSARATFDKNGDIVSIKVLRWSNFDDVQELFEKTIEAIHSLPNPPHEMLDKNDEFSIYFTVQN